METLEAIADLFGEKFTDTNDLQPVDTEAIQGLLNNNPTMAQVQVILRSFALREERLLERQAYMSTPPRERDHPPAESEHEPLPSTSPTPAVPSPSTFDLLSVQAHPHQTNSSILSELNTASKFQDGSITLPKILKGNEIQKLADSA